MDTLSLLVSPEEWPDNSAFIRVDLQERVICKKYAEQPRSTTTE